MANPNEIPLSDAIALTQRYKNSVDDRARRAFLIDKSVFTDLFAQDNATGVRCYLGLNTDNAIELVMVATDSDGKDLITIVMDHFTVCPIVCDMDSPLY
jgi:hypothetical protein